MPKKPKQRKPYKTTRRFKTNQKTTTREGKNEYMKEYMRQRRAEQAICQIDLEKSLGMDLRKLTKVQRPPTR